MARMENNGLQREKLRLNFSSCFRASNQNININGPGLFSLCELVRLCLPDVQDNIVHEFCVA